MRRFLGCVSLGCVAFLFVNVAHANVTVSGSLWAIALEEFGEVANIHDNFSSTPFQVQRNISSPPGSSQTNYDYSLNGDGALFHLDFDHDVHTTKVGDGLENDADISFSSTVPLQYELSGFYQMTGLGALSYIVVMADITTDQEIFRNEQTSYSTQDESFQLGETGGDANNVLTGTMTGSLLPGHTYGYRVNPLVVSWFETEVPPSATGSFDLLLTPVPEPNSLLILMLGGCWLLNKRKS